MGCEVQEGSCERGTHGLLSTSADAAEYGGEHAGSSELVNRAQHRALGFQVGTKLWAMVTGCHCVLSLGATGLENHDHMSSVITLHGCRQLLA